MERAETRGGRWRQFSRSADGCRTVSRLVLAAEYNAHGHYSSFLPDFELQRDVRFDVTMTFSINALLFPAIAFLAAAECSGSDHDAPPPFEVIKHVHPAYPAASRRDHIEGHVTLEMTISVDGHVLALQVVESEPPGHFDSAARDAVRQWRFKPKCGATFSHSFKTTKRFAFNIDDERDPPEARRIPPYMRDLALANGDSGTRIAHVDPCASP